MLLDELILYNASGMGRAVNRTDSAYMGSLLYCTCPPCGNIDFSAYSLFIIYSK